MRKREIAYLVKAAIIAFTPYVAFKMIVFDIKDARDARARAAWEDMKARDDVEKAQHRAAKDEPDSRLLYTAGDSGVPTSLVPSTSKSRSVTDE